MSNLVTKASELINQMDREQLNQVVEAIQLKRNHLAKQAINNFVVGDVASFTGKSGKTIKGFIKKINRKYIVIDCGVDGNWRVPASHLTKEVA